MFSPRPSVLFSLTAQLLKSVRPKDSGRGRNRISNKMAAYPIILATRHFPEIITLETIVVAVLRARFKPANSSFLFFFFLIVFDLPRSVGPGSDKKTARRQQSVNPDDGNNLKPFFSSLPFPFSLLLFFPSSLQFSSYVPWLFCLSLLSFDASLRSIAL